MKYIIRYLILIIGITSLLSLSGCSGDGSDGIQSDGDYNATKPLVPIPPTLPILQPFEGLVSESAVAGEVIGTMIINNVDSVDVVAIVLSGSGFENFLISVEGAVSVASGAKLDYESMNLYTLVATAIDSKGDNLSATTVVISVVDVDENPQETPIIDGAVGNVVENSPAGTTVTNITISSGGDTPITSIRLSGSGSEKFVVSTAGLVVVASGAVLVNGEIYTLDAIATNGAGDSEPAVVTITVTEDTTQPEPEPEPEPEPIPLAPILADSTSSVVENSPAGTSAGSVTISSVGDTPISAITLSGAGSEKFTVAPSGAISVATGAVLTRGEVYSLIAKATNSIGESNPSTVTISVTADSIPDTVPTLADTIASVGRLVPEGTVVGKINIVDIGDSPITAITLIGQGQEDFVVATDGTITVASGTTMVADRVYSLIAKSTNSVGSSNPVIVTITVT